MIPGPIMTADPEPDPATITINLEIAHASWQEALPRLEALVQQVGAEVSQKVEARGEVAIQCADDTAIKALNAQFRGKDHPTNVLAFPDETEGRLGDIILAYETVASEAQAQHKSFANHTAHLVLHGLLHLLGYDHQSDTEAEAMEQFEIEILARMGIPNPYEMTTEEPGT
ncbi:MAG: rRNA maturation RNase YbeY [Rickettsiales bacterium]|nr:rRNA maturation RNase YbeY [Rickettsiales bacterium]